MRDNVYVNAIDDVVGKAGCERSSGQQASLEKKIAAVCVCSSLKTRDDVKRFGSDPGTPSSGSSTFLLELILSTTVWFVRSRFRHLFFRRHIFYSSYNLKNNIPMEQGHSTLEGMMAKMDFGNKLDIEMNPWPDFIQRRLHLWAKYMKNYNDELAKKQSEPITVTFPDGKQVEAMSWRTSPLDIMTKLNMGGRPIISKVDGVLWDLERPLEKSCNLQFLLFDDDEGKQVFWHSTAHVLGEAAERLFGCCLCYGPPIENGFYYDMFMDDRTVTAEDMDKLEKIMKVAIDSKQPFERLELKKEELMEMFKYNPFKLRILENKVKTPTTTAYRCGPLIDLCRGPHVRHTGLLNSFKITKNSSTFWEGDSSMESLQRVYGISFPNSKQLKLWEKMREEAASRDHRKLGRQQELFIFHELSPGSAFFFPRGAYIYNTLVEFLRKQYRKRGFREVITPNIYNSRLWETSGHWQHYAKNMFKNELSGALSGLTRVRRFQQDDAHIFCRQDQIASEIEGCLDFLRFVYETLGFSMKLYLSTRPDDFLGDVKTWDEAEAQLQSALEKFKLPWTLNAGDGAFYGPKIDIIVLDAMQRQHQCATIQLDFQLPVRFDLHYVDENHVKQRPVIIHRAILGSIERMIAVLTENFAGKWPFWLSPRQAMVIPVHPEFDDYALQVQQKIFDAGFECDVDVDVSDTMKKKIRNAQLGKWNFILVVGAKEKENGSVNIRTRDNAILSQFGTSAFDKRFLAWQNSTYSCVDLLTELALRFIVTMKSVQLLKDSSTFDDDDDSTESSPLENKIIEQFSLSEIKKKSKDNKTCEKLKINDDNAVQNEEEIFKWLNEQRSTFTYGLTDDQALTNLIKSTVGTGVLAVPEAFSNAGLWFGLIFLIFTVIINLYCLRILVRTSQMMCLRSGRAAVDYGTLAELSVFHGPKPLRRFKRYAKFLVNISLAFSQLGMCSVYFVFIAEHIKQTVEVQNIFSLATYMAFLLPVFLALCSIRHLKYLAIPSTLANLVYFVAFVITFQYIFQELPSWRRLPSIQSLDRLPLAFGSLMFAFSAAGTILPIENKTKFPKSMNAWNGVLNTSCALSTILYIAVGFYGYIRFGSDVAGSITLNLPKDEPLYKAVKLMVSFVVSISYPMQFYVPMDIVILKLQQTIDRPGLRLAAEYAIRYLLVLITFTFAELVPHLGLFISLVGALTTSALTFIFPPIIEILCEYRGSLHNRRWQLLVFGNLLICLFGMVGLFTGTITSIKAILHSFSVNK
ncbi:Threonine--tRNA ligase, cytoplasmic [Trichinella zimbabwensis]|uniref:threonine--tRNA ligase n=1 Tax=Trichinella zimbabwensis TaxID=268475 RepID=A0A0V1H0P8_9BILA|nr:Threonine--tRNA ligase, cytoplasmic [Trichinella zimbabwensis]